MRLFYNLSDIATKSTTIMTPTHRLLSLNFKGGNLKGSLATLHHLLIKKIVWKFTNQELADGHPKFEPYGVYKLAVESMAISFKQLQQKVYRAHKRAKATGTISSDGRYKKGYPLVTGYKNGRLTFISEFKLLMQHMGITEFDKNPTSSPLRYKILKHTPPKKRTTTGDKSKTHHNSPGPNKRRRVDDSVEEEADIFADAPPEEDSPEPPKRTEGKRSKPTPRQGPNKTPPEKTQDTPTTLEQEGAKTRAHRILQAVVHGRSEERFARLCALEWPDT